MGKTIDKCCCCNSAILASNPALWMPFVADRALGLPPLNITNEMGFRSLENGTAYAMCKSLHCQSCGHLFVDYRFDESEMTNLYSGYRGMEYSSLRSKYEPGYQAQNESLAQGNTYNHLVEGFLSGFLRGTDISILDWGGDTGINTPFGGRSSVIHIYDPSNKPVELKTAVNIYVDKNFLDSYELVVLANVLEHVPFPHETLNELHGFMTSDTVLYVEVPFEKIQASAQKVPPYSLEAQKLHWHEHINFFSEFSLQNVLQRSGFQILGMSVAEIDSGSIGVSFTSILQAACRLSPEG